MTEITWADPADDAAVADKIASVLAGGGRRSFAVSGGRAPPAILSRLAPRWSPDWQADITLTDDRIVPVDHPSSNFAILTRGLGDVPGARLIPLREGEAVGPFDLVWVGVGADGHIASLFPTGTVDPAAPSVVVRTMPDPLPPEAPFERLTLTLEALTSTKELIIVARGAEKKPVLERAIRGEGGLPIQQLIERARCPITIFWTP